MLPFPLGRVTLGRSFDDVPMEPVFQNTLGFTDAFTANLITRHVTDTFGMTQQWQSHKEYPRSWTSTLSMTDTFENVPIVGSWTNSLSLTHSFDRTIEYERHFTNTLTPTQQFGTVPILGQFQNTLGVTGTFQSNSIRSRHFQNTINWGGSFFALGPGRTINSSFLNSLAIVQHFNSHRVITASWTNTLGVEDSYPRGFINAEFQNTLSLDNDDDSERWRPRHFESILGIADSFNHRLDPSRHFTSTLLLRDSYSGALLERFFTLRLGDYILKLPEPELGNRDKRNQKFNKQVAVNGVTYTYLKLPKTDRTWLFDFNTDAYYKPLVQEFFKRAASKMFLFQWQGQTVSAQLLTNPISFEQVSRKRIQFSLSVEGVKS